MTEEDLDTETLIFRQIDRVMRTASLDLEQAKSPQGDIMMDTKTWSHKIVFSAEFLHALLKPLMTEEKHENIESSAKDEIDDFSSSWDKARYSKAIFRQDIEHLQKNNMVFQESDDLIIEDESAEKLEPKSSDVEEEVIE